MSVAQISKEALREHLSNERTLLAWLRTAISLMGFGLVVARFGMFLQTMVAMQPGADAATLARNSDHSSFIGAGLLLLGSIVAVVGWQRMRAYGRIIDPLAPSPSQRVLAVTAFLVAGLGLGLGLYVAVLERVIR